jgi:hypothetical protein
MDNIVFLSGKSRFIQKGCELFIEELLMCQNRKAII